jgi:hypothetical protein
MRIERGQHAVDRRLDQFGLVDLFHVVRPDPFENVAEQIQLFIDRRIARSSWAISGPATCVLRITPPAIPPMAAYDQLVHCVRLSFVRPVSAVRWQFCPVQFSRANQSCSDPPGVPALSQLHIKRLGQRIAPRFLRFMINSSPGPAARASGPAARRRTEDRRPDEQVAKPCHDQQIVSLGLQNNDISVIEQRPGIAHRRRPGRRHQRAGARGQNQPGRATPAASASSKRAQHRAEDRQRQRPRAAAKSGISSGAGGQGLVAQKAAKAVERLSASRSGIAPSRRYRA